MIFEKERKREMLKKSENRKRYVQRLIRLTPSENEQIKRIMTEHGMPSFQYYARNMLCLGRVVKIDFSELKNLRVAINRIGGNINQIAKRANESEEISLEEIQDVLASLSEIKNLIDNTVSEKEERSMKELKKKVEVNLEELW